MNTNISIKQLIIFSKVVSYGSVTEVAKIVNLSPSAVSKSIQALEESLNTSLINRTTRNVSPTEEGVFFHKKIMLILDDLESAFSAVSSKKNYPSGILRVTCSVALGTSQLMNMFSQYRVLYPDVNLAVNLSDNIENLNEGNYDIALRIVNKPPENFAIKKLAMINWKYCATPEYFRKKGIPQKPGEMKNHDCLIYPGLESAWEFSPDLSSSRFLRENNVILQANSSLALLEAALLSLGIVYLPTYLSGDHLKKGDLIEILKEHHSQKQHYLYAIYTPRQRNNINIRSFIDFVSEWLSPIPPWERVLNG
ncbi:LysR family transcriptional regulator [Buttiauxella gaviniae]|uniref:LysR family transcriptional regulator n=1 Tax=Buttiauxella gaviniae TaxID=82990 RepID=UPI0039B09909